MMAAAPSERKVSGSSARAHTQNIATNGFTYAYGVDVPGETTVKSQI